MPPAAAEDGGLFREARPPSLDDGAFDEDDVSERPSYLRHLPRVDRAAVEEHRARLRSLQAVDRAVASLIGTLDAEGVLDDTYVVFTSDNHYSLGEHRYVGKDVLTDEALQGPFLVLDRRPCWHHLGPARESGRPAGDLRRARRGLAGLDRRRHVGGADEARRGPVFRDTTLVQTGSSAEDGWSH